MKIAATCNATEKAIEEKKSKVAIQSLLKRLDQLLADADELNTHFDTEQQHITRKEFNI
jgi:hypothetical protein